MQRPRAAEGDEREVARIVAALDRDDAQRAQHLGVHDRDDRRRVDLAERTLRRLAIELEAARQLLGQPAEQEVRVRDGRARAAPARSRPARARRPRSRARRAARRPRRPRRSSRRRRRPCAGRRSAGGPGSRPTSRCALRSASPPEIRATSVDVPPMSKRDRVLHARRAAPRSRRRRRPPPARRAARTRDGQPPPRPSRLRRRSA